MGKKIKVVGYAQRVFYNDGIEYRNFSDDLVGQQLTAGKDSDEGSTFTNGNFIVTSNFDKKISRLFKTNNFSSYYTLNNLIPTNNALLTNLLSVDALTLNTDPTKLRSYVLFGSLREFIRTSLEEIIKAWPASLKVNNIITDISYGGFTGHTVENYAYDIINNKATFHVNANQLTNPYEIDYSLEGLTLGSYNSIFDTRNFSQNFINYEIKGCNVIGYSAITDTKFGNLHLEVLGNPFPNLTGGTSTEIYHIKPNNYLFEMFFVGLTDFENYLLNRLTFPQYKSTFGFNKITDQGITLSMLETYIWPTSDGYNLDFQSGEYIRYVNNLIDMADASDEVDTNLITRFLTTASISDFDSAPGCDGEPHVTSGAKMNKLLKIYGCEYDEINKFIDGISYAHTVSYDKKDNAPDGVIRLLSRTLGWELTTSLVDNDVLTSYLSTNSPNVGGFSRGLSVSEQEVEFWRRLIINTPWIWKSKGTRKVIEMFFKLIGAPMGLYKFNEYVYTAEKPINMVEFNEILQILNPGFDVNWLNVDSDGYPRILPNTPNMYFQNNGLWYRQTGGVDADVDINSGNNPHVGPYDGGQKYMDQFKCLIPNFSAVTLHHETVTSGITNLYINDSAGDFNGVQNQETVITMTDLNGDDISECMCLTSEIVDSPKPRPPQSDCGCDYEVEDKVLKINIFCNCHIPCKYDSAVPDEHNILTFTFPYGLVTTDLNSWWYDTLDEAKDCCVAVGRGYQPEFDYGNSGIWECVKIEPCEIEATTMVTDSIGTQNNGSIDITNISGVGLWGYSYSAGTTQISSGTISSNSLLLDNLSGGQYYFEITDTYGCRLLSGATITPQPCYMGVDMVVGEACCEHDDGYLDITVSSGTPPWSYQITTGTSENPISAGTTTLSNILLENLPSDTYHLLMLDSHGCSFNNNYYLGTHNCPPLLDPVITDACCDHPDGVLQLTPNPSYPPFTYSYSGSSGYIDTGGETSGVINITGLTADTYTVVITDEYNCSNTSGYTIDSLTCPLTWDDDVTRTCCEHTDGVIDITSIANLGGASINGLIYTLSADGTQISTGPVVGNSISITGLTADTYTVFITDPYNCSNTEVYDTTNYGDCPPSFVIKSTRNTCCNHSGGTVTITDIGPIADGPWDWSYTGESGNISSGTTSSSSPLTLTNLPPGNYDFTLTDAYNCIGSNNFSIGTTDCPLMGTTATTIETCVSGGTISIYDIHNTQSGVPLGDIEYSYSAGTTYISSGETTGDSIYITGLTSGTTYHVYLEDSFNCYNTYDFTISGQNNHYCFENSIKTSGCISGGTEVVIRLGVIMRLGSTGPIGDYTLTFSGSNGYVHTITTSGTYEYSSNPLNVEYTIPSSYDPMVEGSTIIITLVDDYGCVNSMTLWCDANHGLREIIGDWCSQGPS